MTEARSRPRRRAGHRVRRRARSSYPRDSGAAPNHRGMLAVAAKAGQVAASDPIGIRMGTFDGDPGIRPSVRQFVSYAAPWEPIPDDGLPRHPESRHAAS